MTSAQTAYIEQMEVAMDAFSRACMLSPASRLNVTMAQAHLLMCLSRQDRQKMSELGASFGVTLGNMTGLVNRSLRDKLVQRVNDPSDRRVVRVSLTERGRRIAKTILQHKQAMMSRVVDVIPPGDRKKVLEMMTKMTCLMAKPKE